MNHTRYGSKILVRLDPGEDVLTGIAHVCKKEGVRLGSISGIGAVDKAVLGLFRPDTKEYVATTHEQPFEITNLTGNVTEMDGKLYLHVHATLADIENNAIGGHLNEARISATAEIWIDVAEGAVDREFDETVGLNLLKF